MRPGSSDSGPRPPRRLISIRASLLLSIAIMLLALGAATMLGLLISSSRLLMRTANTVITAREAEAAASVNGFFHPVKVQTLAAEHWALSGLLSAADTASAARLLMPLCDGAPQISAAYLCDGESSISMQRAEEGWLSTSVSPAQPGISQWALWPEPHEKALRTWTSAGSEDLSSSHWYQAAMQGSSEGSQFLQWSEDSTESEGTAARIALSHRIDTQTGRPLVLAYDIRLDDLDEFIDELKPTPGGYVVVCNLDGELMESAQEDEDSAEAVSAPADDEEPAMRPPIEEQEYLFEEALQAWQSRRKAQADGEAGTLVPRDWLKGPSVTHAFRFPIRGAPWWIGVSPLVLDGAARFYLIVLVPERDLSREFTTLQLTLFAIGSISLIAALLLGNRLATAYSRPIAALAADSQRFRRLDLRRGAELSGNRVLEISQLVSAHESMRSALDSFSRYLPLELVRELLSRGEAARLGGELRELTILISDIRGFTAISDELYASQLVEQLGKYNNILLEVLRRHNATVDKLTGDGIVAFWGAPQADEEQSAHAVAAALEAAERVAQFNAEQARAGLPQFPTCFGIARGNVVVGNIGADWRLNYTALGDAVNLASRLQHLNRQYGTTVLVGPRVRAAAGDVADWRLVGHVEIRGIADPVEVYEARRKAGT